MTTMRNTLRIGIVTGFEGSRTVHIRAGWGKFPVATHVASYMNPGQTISHYTPSLPEALSAARELLESRTATLLCGVELCDVASQD